MLCVFPLAFKKKKKRKKHHSFHNSVKREIVIKIVLSLIEQLLAFCGWLCKSIEIWHLNNIFVSPPYSFFPLCIYELSLLFLIAQEAQKVICALTDARFSSLVLQKKIKLKKVAAYIYCISWTMAILSA